MPAEDPFREIDEQLASLAAASKSLREQRPSWLDNILHPGRQARREAEFGASVVAALKKTVHAVQEARAGTTEVERRLAELQGERLARFKSDLDQLRAHQEQLTRESARTAQNWTDRAAEIRQQVEQLAREQKEIASGQSGRIDQTRNEQSEKIDRLIAAQIDLGNELRERIQHLLDEQRVAIRQLSLKASEDAVLSDRARRAAELKMDELAKRIPPPPA
ncbi:MAG TPA: hypothetical protein VJU77_04675 [Chthoniobacterales bacterium]|nr:hypothetical protein [Chthoniobacterales bacterium]